MDPEGKNFGKGPRELTGAVDLISHFKLLPHHEFFCKKSLPLAISDTHYLHNVVGDTEIRKGDGMQLDQLLQNTSSARDSSSRIQPFDLDTLRDVFQFRETAPVDLSPVNQEVSQKIRIRSIKSIKTEIKIRIKIKTESIKSINTATKIEARIKTKRRRRRKAAIMILVLIPLKSTTKRNGSMMAMKILMITDTRRVSIRVQNLMRLAP